MSREWFPQSDCVRWLVTRLAVAEAATFFDPIPAVLTIEHVRLNTQYDYYRPYTMDSSPTETSEHSSNHETDRPADRIRAERIPMERSMRALLGVEGVSFLLASTIHAGILITGYVHRDAMVAEGVIGVVLLVGLATTWIRPRSLASIAAAVQSFALVGTLIGLWMILIGVGPRTVPDVVYHVVIVGVLLVGLGLAWRIRSESG